MSFDSGYTVIQTRYHGCRFRSRLEARWAVFFDTMGAEWEYEPEGYRLDDDVCYLPDFYLPASELFVEVKPKAPDVHERRKAALLSAATKSHVVIVAGIPQSGNRRPGPHFLWVNGADADKAEISYCEPCNRLQAHDLWSAKCLWCGSETTTDHPKLVSACSIALSHRFETPERVNPILTPYDLAATHIAVHGRRIEPQELCAILENEGFDLSCQGVRQAILDNCVPPRAER